MEQVPCDGFVSIDQLILVPPGNGSERATDVTGPGPEFVRRMVIPIAPPEVTVAASGVLVTVSWPVRFGGQATTTSLNCFVEPPMPESTGSTRVVERRDIELELASVRGGAASSKQHTHGAVRAVCRVGSGCVVRIVVELGSAVRPVRPRGDEMVVVPRDDPVYRAEIKTRIRFPVICTGDFVVHAVAIVVGITMRNDCAVVRSSSIGEEIQEPAIEISCHARGIIGVRFADSVEQRRRNFGRGDVQAELSGDSLNGQSHAARVRPLRGRAGIRRRSDSN